MEMCNILFIIILLVLAVVSLKSGRHRIDILTVILLLVAFLFVLFSLYAPTLFTQYSSTIHFDEQTGVIGDTIGGIMNPFISIAAVIVTGLAFYAQYRANDMVRKQFEIQKFENQFYQRLRLHKENINEIEIEIESKGKLMKGRVAFYQMLEDLEQELEKEKSNVNDRQAFQEKVYSKFYKEYGKHISHYFRHLFHTVEFVVNQNDEIIDKKQKREYLQILIIQMSNDEHKLLFYDWLAPNYGGPWEELDERKEGNHFFTEYRMIYNLWYDELVKCELVKNELVALRDRYKDNKYEDYFFEQGDDIERKFKVNSK